MATIGKIPEKRFSVYHVVEGIWYTEVDVEQIEWTRYESFCVPALKKHRHHNTYEEKAHLFSFWDRPLLESWEYFDENKRTLKCSTGLHRDFKIKIVNFPGYQNNETS